MTSAQAMQAHVRDTPALARRLAQSLACFERYVTNGTYDSDSALRLLISDARNVAKAMHINASIETRHEYARLTLREFERKAGIVTTQTE